MDNILASSRLAIGWSSNLAMLSLTYYWTELAKGNQAERDKLKEYYDIFVILAIAAQIGIDSSKRVYSVSAQEEVIRIQNLPCMQYIRYEIDANGKKKKYKYDLPKFMKYVREPAHTKDGNLIPYEVVKKNKTKLNRRINPDFICPMNWLVECLDRTMIRDHSRTHTVSIKEFFIKEVGWADNRQMSKLRKIIDEYDMFVRTLKDSTEDDSMIQKTENVIEKIKGIKMGKITVNRLVETALGLESGVGATVKGFNKKYCRKFLNMIYKTNQEYFLHCFKNA